MHVYASRSALSLVSVGLFTLVAMGICWAYYPHYVVTTAVPAATPQTVGVVATPPDAALAAKVNNVLSVKVMTRGYCYAGSPLRDTKALGGFATSLNLPHRVTANFKGSGMYLLAQPEVLLPFNEVSGMRVCLVNRTSNVLAFEASDSRLSIIQEARDAEGNWKPIEYLPSSWCGNSYHRVFLPADHFWAFAAPRYSGSLPTKLRFAMKLSDGSDIYSNEFEGSVNPEQFSVKEGHTATNIMDPYND